VQILCLSVDIPEVPGFYGSTAPESQYSIPFRRAHRTGQIGADAADFAKSPAEAGKCLCRSESNSLQIDIKRSQEWGILLLNNTRDLRLWKSSAEAAQRRNHANNVAKASQLHDYD
jgi:hypothetical protein